MLWPFLKSLFVALARRAQPYALPLSAGLGMLALSGAVALFWLLAWSSPSTVAYTGNGRVALAAGVFQLWAMAAVVLTAQQPPIHATTLQHPVVFAGAFWLLAGTAVFFLFALVFDGAWMDVFSVACLLWSGLFAFAFPRLASKTDKEIRLFFAPFFVAIFLASLVATSAVLSFFQLSWIVDSRSEAIVSLVVVMGVVLFFASLVGAVVVLKWLDGAAFYGPLLLAKGHSTPEQVGALALSFALQRHPTLLAGVENLLMDRSIGLHVSAYGTVQHAESPFLHHLVERQHGRTAADAFAEALQQHLRGHTRMSHFDVCRAGTDWHGRGKEIQAPLRDAVEACLRSKHAHLAAIAAAGPAPVPALP